MSIALTRKWPAAAILAAAALLLLALSAASGHEGGPRLILEPTHVNPGGVVLVRGEDLGLDEPMQVSLVGQTGRMDLVAVETDGQGHFTVAITLPVDIANGTFAVETKLSTGAPIRSNVRIEGAPVQPDGAGAPPGQDEGLPALGATAAPTSAPVAASVASAVVPAVVGGSSLTPLADPGTEFDPVPFVAFGGAVGALGFLAWRTTHRRPPTEQIGSADLS